MTSDFTWSHRFTAKWEGGVTSHPDDPGGETAYGVSRRFYADLLGAQAGRAFLKAQGLPMIPQVTNLTREDAAKIFAWYFWERPRICELPRACAFMAYDAAVNCGAINGVKFAQRAATRVTGAPLAIDGKIGPKTLAAVRAGDDRSDLPIARAMAEERLAYYERIVKANPRLGSFLKGWRNRTNAALEYLQ